MPEIRNVSPYGALDVPLLRRTVGAGETVEVTVEQARVLLDQAENWEKAGAKTKTRQPSRKPKAAAAAPDNPTEPEAPASEDGDQ